MGLGLSLAAGAAGTIGDMLGGKAGKIVGGIGKLFGIGADSIDERRKMEMQFAHEKEMMGLQNQYNEAMAQANQERSKEMWDYTNYENQVKHMKNAGLSVGLMYGNGGGGGSSTAGAQGSGVSNPGTSAVAAGLQARQMGLSLRQMEAQTRLAEAQAHKAEVDAGVGKTQIDINELRKKIMWSEEQITAANITTAVANSQKAMVEWNDAVLSLDIKKEQKEAIVGQAFAEWSLTRAQGALAIAQKNLTEEQKNKVRKEIEYFATEVATRRMSAEAAKKAAEVAADKVAKEFEIAGQKIDLETKKMIGDWIAAGVGTVTDMVKAFGPGKIVNAIKEVFKDK